MSPEFKIVVFIFYHDVDLRKAAVEEENHSDKKLLDENNIVEDEKTELLQKFTFEEKMPRIIDSIPTLLIQEQVS